MAAFCDQAVTSVVKLYGFVPTAENQEHIIFNQAAKLINTFNYHNNAIKRTSSVA
jgi:hypothetical protein